MTYHSKLFSVLALLVVALIAEPALASIPVPTKVSEPGVLGLVAMGVVGTILAVRRRK